MLAQPLGVTVSAIEKLATRLLAPENIERVAKTLDDVEAKQAEHAAKVKGDVAVAAFAAVNGAFVLWRELLKRVTDAAKVDALSKQNVATVNTT